MKHVKYKLSDWIEAKRKAKYRAMLLGIKEGLEKFNHKEARELLKKVKERL